MMKKLFATYLFLFISIVTFAQSNEIGVFLGGSNYIGDIGSTNYIWPNHYAVGGIYKWNMHPHYSIRGTYTYAKIAGYDSKSNNSFRENRGLRFTNTLHELAVGIEYNFFEFGNNVGRSRTPYIFVEAAVNNYSILKKDKDGELIPKKDDDGNPVPNQFEKERIFNYTIPFGIGFKGKLAYNIGYAIETSFRYTFNDDIDGYPYQKLDKNGNPPPGENIQINPNNNDWYVFTGVTFVYTFDTNSRSWKHIWEANQQKP